jgi:GNAT superfamily N-acetyltransferase
MEITQAKSTDLVEILYLLKICTRDMNEKGFKHWNNAFPGTDQIPKDIQEGNIYLAKDKRVCKGMFILNSSEPDDYKQLNLNSADTKPLFLSRMAVHPKWQGKGIASLMVDFAQKTARAKGYTCIRMDIYQSSEEARKICEKLSFKEVGTFQTKYQQVPYVCYEKQL